MAVLKHPHALLTFKFMLQQNETEIYLFTSPSPFKISAEILLKCNRVAVNLSFL